MKFDGKTHNKTRWSWINLFFNLIRWINYNNTLYRTCNINVFNKKQKPLYHRSTYIKKNVESGLLHTITTSLQTIWYIASGGFCNEMNYSIEALKWSACDNNIHYPIKQSENATCFVLYQYIQRGTQSTPSESRNHYKAKCLPHSKVHTFILHSYVYK